MINALRGYISDCLLGWALAIAPAAESGDLAKVIHGYLSHRL